MSPRQRSTKHDDDGGDDVDIRELIEEVRGIREEREELRGAIEELRKAKTPGQRQRAERDVRDAESDLAKALRAAGYPDVDEEDLRALRTQRQRSQFDEWYEERRAAEREEEAGGDDGEKGKQKRRRAKKSDGDGGDDGGDGAGDDDTSKGRYFS